MGKYQTIVNYILEKVASGKIKAGQNMPTVRELSEKFACSKVTVVRAYAELQKQHMVYAIPQCGYFLVNKIGVEERAEGDRINFASASPDESILPYEEFQHCLNQAINKYEQILFNYANPKGLPSLVNEMIKHLQEYQVFAKPENLFITAGSQQAIHILCNMEFPNHKKTVLVEQPTYNGMIGLLTVSNIPVMSIERNFNGIDLEELEKIFAANTIKCFYTTPRYHNPLGTSLSKEEKKAIVKLANQYDVYIIEDDYLADLEMKNNSYSMYYEDVHSRVIYIKSFSKTLLPGLRVAAVVLPELLVNTFLQYKKWLDLGTSVLSQGALEIYIKCGMFNAHRKKIRSIYAEKMKVLTEVVKSKSTPQWTWHVPDSGFFACVEFENAINLTQMLAALDKKNIKINRIKENYLDSYEHHKILKLSMSKSSQNHIQQGISVILDEMAKMDGTL